MWQGIQSVFKKKAKSPDPNKHRLNRSLAAEQSSGSFALNVQRTNADAHQGPHQEDNSPFAEAVRLAKIEQQKQGTSHFRVNDDAQAVEHDQGERGKRMSIGSPIKGLLSLSAKLVRGLSEEQEENKQGQLAQAGSLQSETGGQALLNQLTQDQKNVAYLLGNTSKVESLVLGLHGFRINDNPQDREVFLSCPNCSLDVFDSGLSHDIECKKCRCVFAPGQKHRSLLHNQQAHGLARLESVAQVQDQAQAHASCGTESDSGGSLPREVSAFDLNCQANQDDAIREAAASLDSQKRDLQKIASQEGKDYSQPLDAKMATNQGLEEIQSIQGPFEQQLNQVKVEADFYEDEHLQQRVFSSDYDQLDNSSFSSETDSEEESKEASYARKLKKGRGRQQKGVAFTADNLIERPGQVISSLFSSLRMSQSQRQEAQSASQIDSSSVYVNELESAQLFVIEETVMQDFKDPQTHEINYKLILDALLMPFFQLQTRILEKQAFFTIGEIQFFVASTAPHDFGKVSRKTRVKLSAAVERSQSIQRINLVPLRRLDMSKHELLQSVLKPYFSSNIGNCLFKAQVFEIQEQEFFVKYCRPFFGVISNGTEVKMDSSMPKSVRVVRVAPIWPTKEAFAFASRQSEESIRLIKQEILHPYFFSGSMCYIEKGETIKIAGHDFFINECQPRAGIVDESSAVEVEIGFTQETFQKKQVLADQRYAERLQQQIAGSQGVSPNVVSLARPATFAEHHPAELDYQQYLRDLEAAEAQNLNRPSNQINSRISLGSFRGVGGSGSSRRRRRHSQNHNAVGSGASETRFHLEYSPSLMQAYGAQAEEFQRQHSSHLYGSQSLSQSQAQPDLIEILTQIRQDGINIDELQIADQLRHTSQNATPKSIVDSLPVRTITEEQVMTSKGQAQKEEAMAKCMICLVDYEAQDELRTMPCMHFFHRECIDRWLLKQGQTCPICKFNVRQDYNITSSAQITQNRRTSERQSYILRPADLDFYSDD